MRRVRTVVLPVPAPATMRSGPWSWVTASAWAGFRPSRISWAAESSGSGAARERGVSARDTPDLSARPRHAQASAGRGEAAQRAPAGALTGPRLERGLGSARAGCPGRSPVDATSAAVDGREPVAVGRLLAPDHGEVAGLDRPGDRARIDAV